MYMNINNTYRVPCLLLWQVPGCITWPQDPVRNTGFLLKHAEDELTVLEPLTVRTTNETTNDLANTSCRLVQWIYRPYITAWIQRKRPRPLTFPCFRVPRRTALSSRTLLIDPIPLQESIGKKAYVVSPHFCTFWLILQVLDYSKSGWRTFAIIWCLNVYDSYHGSTAPHYCK